MDNMNDVIAYLTDSKNVNMNYIAIAYLFMGMCVVIWLCIYPIFTGSDKEESVEVREDGLLFTNEEIKKINDKLIDLSRNKRIRVVMEFDISIDLLEVSIIDLLLRNKEVNYYTIVDSIHWTVYNNGYNVLKDPSIIFKGDKLDIDYDEVNMLVNKYRDISR